MKNFYQFTFTVLFIFAASLAKSQPVPVYSSYPNASSVILLDFDGHEVSGTSWNVYGQINCKPSGLNNTQITEVFNRVAEDFRPFDVNVTTNETVFNAAPANKKIRIIITTTHAWYGTGAGGVAFINSFTWGDNTPAFVFSSLFKYSEKNIAESVSHEAGHTLGLKHQSAYDKDCRKISDYNWGQGSGEIGWAPIMGASYNQNMTLWHHGPTTQGCDKFQSDLGIITSTKNGFGFREDDHSDSFSSATLLDFKNDQFEISGVIERTEDKDLFKFNLVNAGKFQLKAIPYNVGTGNAGSDLDLQIEFLDVSNKLIGTYNPGSLLSSIIDTILNKGIYYIRVEGKGNIYAPEYASLGSYSMKGTYSKENFNAANKPELREQPLKPQLTGNIISGSNISVSSPGNFLYQILDQSGRLIRQGSVSNGTNNISTGIVSAGFYFIRFSKDEHVWSEKFVKN